MKRLLPFLVLVCIIVPALSAAAPLTRPLAVGSRGEDVSALQKVLKTLGFFAEEPTGYFGKITRAAVIAFQTSNNLEPVGSVGPKTRALVNAYMLVPEKPAPPAETPPPPPEAPAAPTVPASLPTTTPETATSTEAATPPDTLTITVITPASVLPAGTQYATFLVTTNRNALCRFGTNPNMEFSRKTAFKNSGGQSHSYEFSGLGNGNLYVYYVQCEDATTLKLSPEVTVSFSVAVTSAEASPRFTQLAAIASIINTGELWPAFDPVAAILRGFGFK